MEEYIFTDNNLEFLLTTGMKLKKNDIFVF